MKSFRWKVWRYGKRVSVLIVVVVGVVLLLGGGAFAFFLNGGFGPAASSNSVNLSKGLVGWWKMDGNTQDSSPYGDDGALSGISVVQGPIMTTSSNTSSLAATWPAATTAGNTLVAVITFNNTPTSPAVAPSGWTLRSGAANAWGTQVYEIVNSASRSGAESFTWGGNEDATLWLFELSGVDNTTPDDITVSYSGSGTDAKALGPVTAGANASMAFAIADSSDGCATSWSMTSTGWQVSNGYRARLGYLSINGGQSLQAVFSAGCTWKGTIVSFNTPATDRPSLTTDRKSATNRAYKTGTKQDIRFNATPSLDTQYLTVNAWVYYTASNASQTAVSRTKSSAINGDWMLVTGANNTQLFSITGKGSVGTAAGTGYPWNTWMMLTGTYDGTNIAFYLNGQLIGTQVASTGGALPSGLDALAIGGRGDGSFDYQHGGVDDVRIYNRALSNSEIQALYNTYNDPLDAAQAEKGLVGWWKLDGNLKDSTPYAGNCTQNGGTASFVVDRHSGSGGAYKVNSTNSKGSQCSIPSLAQTAANVTYSAWVKPDSWNSNGDGILSFGVTVQFYFDSTGHLTMGLTDSTGTAHYLATTSAYATGNWYLVTATYDGSTMRLYVNGSEVINTSYTTGIRTDSGTLLLGNYWSFSSGRTFLGTIDDARIYNRALSATEVANLYHSYNSQISLGGDGQSTSTSINLQKGLVGYWPMNGNAKDATPYADDGTKSGGSSYVNDRRGRAISAYNSTGNAMITIPNASQLNVTTVSVSLWIQTTTAGIKNILVSNTGTSPYPYGLQLQTNGTVCFMDHDNTGTAGAGTSVCSSGSVTDGQWHFIVGTRVQFGQLAIYVDGALQSTATDGAATSSTNTNPICIGDGCGGGVNPAFDGPIDDVRIYNRALNASEIQALYSEYQ